MRIKSLCWVVLVLALASPMALAEGLRILSWNISYSAFEEEAEEFQSLLQWADPDIVLLHIGTNDLIANESVDGTVTEIRGVIGALRRQNRQVAILRGPRPVFVWFPGTSAGIRDTKFCRQVHKYKLGGLSYGQLQ